MSLKRAWPENAARRTSKMVLLDVGRETSHSSLAPLISVSKKAKRSFCLFSFALSFLFIFLHSAVLFMCVKQPAQDEPSTDPAEPPKPAG